MIIEKCSVSARVDGALKHIVQDSEFNHKDAYEIGAMIIAAGDAENTIITIHNNPNYERVKKQKEYDLINKMKNKLEEELKEL